MREINIYGTGITALRFLLSNKNDIKVSCFIEGKKDISSFMGYKVVNISDAAKEFNARYTVVASTENVYFEIKRILEKEYGLEEFKDFEYFDTYNKKIAVICGNCHVVLLNLALKSSEEFNYNYGIYPVPPIQDITDENREALDSVAFEKCSLFIHQCIRKNTIGGEKYSSERLLKKLSGNCKVIAFPNFYKMPRFMYPQLSDENPVRHLGIDDFFDFKDVYIDANYKNMSIDELCDMIEDENTIDKSKVINEMNQFYEKLYQREKDWDVKVFEFIKENIRHKLLFYDYSYPAKALMDYMVSEVFKMLNFDYNELFRGGVCFDSPNYPIYGGGIKSFTNGV